MRIIDQWGSADISYENAAIVLDEGNIIAYMSAAAGNNLKILLAEYSDGDVERTAMKKLRIHYQRNLSTFERAVGNMTEYFQFPPEEHL